MSSVAAMRRIVPLRLGVGALAAVALATACGQAKPVEIRGNSLALVDAHSGKVVADVPVGRDPTRVAYGQGAFWVVSPEAGVVFRVDADTKKASRFRIGTDPYDVAVGAGALWVPDHDGQRLFRFDLESHALRETRNLGVPAISVGFGFRSVWLALADGRLLRVDPRTLSVEKSIPDATTAIEGSEPKLAFDRGATWISSPAESSLTRIDPVRGTVHRRILTGATGISAGASAIWVADDQGAIWRFGAGRSQRIEVGSQAQDIAATSKSVWVVGNGPQRLMRIDPASRRVRARIRLGHHPIAVAAGGNVVAVALLGTSP